MDKLNGQINSQIEKDVLQINTLKKQKHEQPTDEMIRAMVSDAIGTPSGDNAQPWRFHWNGEKLLILHSQSLAQHTMNRKDHASMLALGTVIQALRLSATYYGFILTTKLLLQNNQSLSTWAEIRFQAADIQPDPLSHFITRRATDRRPYKGGIIDQNIYEKMLAIQEEFPGCKVHISTEQSDEFMQYYYKTEKFLWSNVRIVRDLSKWLRLTKHETTHAPDGMSWKNAGMNVMDALVFRLIKRFPILPKLLWNLGFGVKIRSMAKTAINSSAALLCFTSTSLEPEALCRTGEFAYRIWLLMNASGFGVQPMSYASSSIADLVSGAFTDARAEERALFYEGQAALHHNFGLGREETPVWMFRTGLSSPLPQDMRAPRQKVRNVILSKNYQGKFDYDTAFLRNLGWVSRIDQEQIRNSRVAIAGQGGVGGAHLLTLVRLGMTKFHIADFDVFDTKNFNRQVGANLSTVGRSKTEVMVEQARLINPEIEIIEFREGVTKENMEDFLKDVDVYIDGLDAFVLDMRSEVFAACQQRKIPAITVAPIGMGAALLTFMPGEMSFEQYFGLNDAQTETEKIGRFILGLTPSNIQSKAVADFNSFRLEQKEGGSTSMGISLAAGVMGTEVLKVILNRGDVRSAPHGLHFDAYSHKYKKTWMPFGKMNPLFKLKLMIFNFMYMKKNNSN